MLLFVLFFAKIWLTDAATELSCYHCAHVNHTYDCATVEKCNGAYEACYIEDTSQGGYITYTQGCIPSHLCENQPGSSAIGKRGVDQRQVEHGGIQCCYTNQCNQRHTKEASGLVFRITPHIGGDVVQAWLHGDRCITRDYCRNVYPFGCGEHYRNNAIDNWENLNISVVKYAQYQNETEVAYIFFNATGSNMTNWFTQARVINSTWVDLKNTTVNSFGIEAIHPTRRFYINEEWNGCGNDRGWTVIVVGPYHCNFDNMPFGYPYILYSKLPTYGHYDEFQQFGEADVAAVFIYFE